MGLQDFISVAYSGDSKFMVTQTGVPEWNLHFWSWEKGKVLASVRTAGDRVVPIAGGKSDIPKDPLNGQAIYQWYCFHFYCFLLVLICILFLY